METPECVSGHLNAVIDPDLRVNETQTASDGCCLAVGGEDDVSSQGWNSEREKAMYDASVKASLYFFLSLKKL